MSRVICVAILSFLLSVQLRGADGGICAVSLEKFSGSVGSFLRHRRHLKKLRGYHERLAAVSEALGGSVLLPVFRRIEAGSFMMGSPKDEEGRFDDEGPVPVEITRPYRIMDTQWTQLHHFLYTGKAPSYFQRKGDCESRIFIEVGGEEFWMCPDNPVEQVSWNEVQEVVQIVNISNGLFHCTGVPGDPSGCVRLPTEAEWEYAARGEGKITTRYETGDLFYFISRVAWHGGNSEERTHPVNSKRSGENGLYGMTGNVWEWVQDVYNKELLGGKDPLYEGEEYLRSLRGGSWSYDDRSLRLGLRGSVNPAFPLPLCRVSACEGHIAL